MTTPKKPSPQRSLRASDAVLEPFSGRRGPRGQKPRYNKAAFDAGHSDPSNGGEARFVDSDGVPRIPPIGESRSVVLPKELYENLFNARPEPRDDKAHTSKDATP